MVKLKTMWRAVFQVSRAIVLTKNYAGFSSYVWYQGIVFYSWSAKSLSFELKQTEHGMFFGPVKVRSQVEVLAGKETKWTASVPNERRRKQNNWTELRYSLVCCGHHKPNERLVC